MEYKKIGPFLERGISFRGGSRTGYKKLAERGISFSGISFLEWGANLESWAAHTHPKDTPPGNLTRD